MATVYRHKKSEIGSNSPSSDDLQTGELAINLASGKLHTTRTLSNATFVGIVSSVAESGTTTLTLESTVATTVSNNDIIAARSTDSSGPAFAPNINRVCISNGTTNTDSFDVKNDSTFQGRQFVAGDYIWLIDTDTDNDSEQIVEISGQTSIGAYPPLNPSTGDVWIDIEDSSDPKIRIFGDSEFIEFVSDSGTSTDGGSSGFASDSLDDSDTDDIDFGLVSSLGTDRNTALATTYSAVEYDFGGIRSPRPGPDFGGID